MNIEVPAGAEIPWPAIHIVQVDERAAPPRHNDRNLTHLFESLLPRAPLPPRQVHAMSVESPDFGHASCTPR